MNDEDLVARLRRARPDTPRRDLPLAPRHEATLHRIMKERHVDSTSIASNRFARPYTRGVWFIAASLLLVLSVAGIGAMTVVRAENALAATPPVLLPEAVDGTAEENLRRISRSVRDIDAAAQRAVRFETWALAFDPESGAAPDEISPEEHTIQYLEDGAVQIEVRASGSYDSQGNVIPGTHATGAVLWSATYSAAESGTIFDAPPTRAEEFAGFFERSGAVDRDGSAGDYFAAARLLLSEAPLSGAQEAALIEFLSLLPEVVVDGAVADRLQRDGVAFSTESRAPGEYRDTLVLSPRDGLLSYEVTYIGSTRADLESPAVIEYIAWK